MGTRNGVTQGGNAYNIGDLVSDSETGNLIPDAVYKRNTTLSEKYGIAFEEIESGNVTFRNDVGNRIATGDTSYQALYDRQADSTACQQDLIQIVEGDPGIVQGFFDRLSELL